MGEKGSNLHDPGTRALYRVRPDARYLDRAGLDAGWLVMFDLRKEIPWSEKLTTRVVEAYGKRVHIVGC